MGPIFSVILIYSKLSIIVIIKMTTGSGCGSVGRAVASDTRGPRFESSHRQKIILNIYCQLYWKDENKEKEAGNGPFKKNKNDYSNLWWQNRPYCYLHHSHWPWKHKISIKGSVLHRIKNFIWYVIKTRMSVEFSRYFLNLFEKYF